MDKFEKVFLGWGSFCVMVGLALTGFAIWVILKLLTHFGVI